MGTPESRIESLLLHDGFVRGLARSLLADPHAADDVAQETFLAALEGQGKAVSAPRWLAGVVRNLAGKARRGEVRRARRERDSARPEATPSAEEILEREAARARIVAAVLALEEPYRTSVLLRYFENLPPRAIARRQAVPVETVRTRLKRALEMLRMRLDREYSGDRRAWGLALLPFARLSSVSLTPIAVLMTLQTKLAVGVAVLAVAVVLLVTRQSSDPASQAEARAEPAAVLVQPAETAQAPELRVPDAAPERVALLAEEPRDEPAAPEPFGALRVRVSWWDEAPASGVHARVEPRWSSGDPSWRALEAVTDAAGEFRLEHLALGNASVQLDREGGGWAVIEAGQETTHEIQLERGFDVAGVVLDPTGRAVSGADIWLSYPHSSEEGLVIAQSAADGHFFVRSCSGGLIGARAARFAPSLLQTVRAVEGARLELELVLMGPGGELTGTVFDPEGNPVPSAWVMAGEGTLWQVSAVPLGGARPITGLRFARQETRTDAEGRYRVRGLAPGNYPVVVRAAGYGPARGQAEVFEHGSATLDVRLAPGVTLQGRVVDREGRALEAEVRVGHYDALGSQTATDEDGAFRLEDLEPAEFEVVAESESRRARTTLRGSAGETLTWDVVLADGGAIRGLLMDEHGAGLAGWHILVEDEGPRAADACGTLGHAKTDAEGRFTVEGVGDHRHRLEAHADGPMLFSPAVATGVFPEREDVLLRVDSARLPSVRIVGAVLDQDGRPVPSARIRLMNPAFGRAASASPGTDGSFDLGPYPPGTWRLSVRAAERADCPELLVGPHELAAGETWDCGALELQPGGTLRVRVTSAARLEPVLVVLQGTVWRGKLHAEGDEWRSDPLAPGSYRLALRGRGVVAALVPFAIRAGETTELELPLVAGPELEVRVLADTAGPNQKPVLRLSDAQGASVIEEELWPQRSGDHGLELALAPGVYRAEAWLPCGARAEAEWVVGAGASAPLVLELR